MSKVHQALKKAEMERVIKKDLMSFSETEEEPSGYADFPAKSSFDERLVSLLDPKSIVSEQYRKLRTRILKLVDSGPRTILITSSTSQEGKSLTAANLAVTVAQGVDQHVLLVDGDLRQPFLHKFFGLNPQWGLTDYLTKDVDLSKILLETGIDKLKLLPSGQSPERPSELIASKKMRNLIQELKARYDDRYIIIDSTPFTVTDEAYILSKQVDGVLLVVRSGKTPSEVLERTFNTLNNDNILGIVFNDVTLSVKRGIHDYSYRY